MPEASRWWLRLGRQSGTDDPDDRIMRRHGILLLAAAVLAAVVLLSQTGPWRVIEGILLDYMTTTWPPPRPVDGPVIVAIDEPSFAEIGRQWPWPRSLHGQLVEALRAAGAGPIGVDIIFAEPSADYAADGALVTAMRADVVLAADETRIETPQATQVVRVEPLQALTDAGARPGIASVLLDGDGTLRRMPRFEDGFAAELLALAGATAPEVPQGAIMQSFGPNRTYTTVSYYQALDPENFLPPDMLRGRPVIIGLSLQSSPEASSGGADVFATAHTLRTGRLVAGAEVQATVYDNLAHRLFVIPASWLAAAALMAGAALAAAVAVWRNTGIATLAGTLLAVAGCVAASYLLLRFGRVHVSPLAPSLAFAAVAAGQGARDYAAERRRRRVVTRAFSQYLSPVLVERLARNPDMLKLGGERRTLTVLFTDVRGFTTISERLKDDPEQLTTLVNRLLNPLSNVILEAGGTIDKYIGDAIMAFWNAPLDEPDHAERAVTAAFAMLDAVDALNAELAAEAEADDRTPVVLKIGAGINTGECVVGNLGSDSRFNYSALGDAVNLAARLEGLTKAYGVALIVGPETARRLPECYAPVELDRVAVKGKTERLGIFAVLHGADSAALDVHRAVVEEVVTETLADDDARLGQLAGRLPELADYYAAMSARMAGKIDHESS